MQRDTTTGRYSGKRNGRSHKNSTNSHRVAIAATTGVMSLISGVALGAAAMYLVDPEHGSRRRGTVLAVAQRALGSTSDAAQAAYQSASDKAAQVGSAAYGAMPSRDDISNGAHSLFDSARRLLSRRPRLEQHSDYAMNPRGVAATALGTLMLGAAAMWVLDPSKGHARRAWVGQKTSRLVRNVGGFARSTGRHLGNKTKGYYHEAASRISHLHEHEASTPE